MSTLLKHGLATVLLLVCWFGLASLNHSIIIQSLLGWAGLGVIALYWSWLLRKNGLRRPKS